MIDQATALLTIAAAKKEAGKAVADAMPAIERVVRDAIEAREIRTMADLAVTLKGDAGPKGDRGDNGANGRDGRDGIDGKDGAKGDRGPAGQDGKDGRDGKDGPRGLDGATGASGRDGADGVGVDVARINGDGNLIITLTSGQIVNAGRARPKDTALAVSVSGGGGSGGSGGTGPAGADGADGQDGASAYDVAVANGFVGTEADWLASLRGADGAAGPQGPAGANGADGAMGPQGPAGPQGVQGPAGAAAGRGTAQFTGNNYLEPEVTIAAPAITGTEFIAVSLAATTDDDENTIDMTDVVSLVGIAGAGSVKIYGRFSVPTSGIVKLNWVAM